MPSHSPKQAKLMRAVAHNPSFAKKTGIPQSVGRDYHQADQRLGKLKRRYAKGGFIREGIEAVRGMDPRAAQQRMSEIMDQIKNFQEGTPEHDALLDEMTALERRMSGRTERPMGTKPETLAVPAREPEKLPPHLGENPYTGTPFNNRDDVLEAIRGAVEESSDEPDWMTANALLDSLSETDAKMAKVYLSELRSAYDSPDHSVFDRAMRNWMLTFEKLKAAKAAEGPAPIQRAKGGQVKSVKKKLSKLKKAIRPNRETVDHQVIVDDTQGETVDGMVMGDLGDATGRKNFEKGFKIKKDKVVDKDDTEEFHDVKISGPRTAMQKFKKWQKKEGL